MTAPEIRTRDMTRDRAAVEDLFHRAADYVLLETGLPPTPANAKDFFTDAPPGQDPATGLKLGCYHDDLLAGIADVAFGYPDLADAYIGLMLFDPDCRGQGLGAAFLNDIVARVRMRGANRLLLAVLEDNPRGRAFWESQGFAEVLRAAPARIGAKTHVRYRMARPV